ncbi:hypothetical protein ACQPU1_14520 [Clostridium paraputrificum]|uniref:hypothetical protein n=1 Tax=Clostridium TaxID=1485 RepID=UPI003D328305
MSILFGATCILAILFMATFMFIGIWLFIVALKAFRQLRYKNYILEKIYQKLDNLGNKTQDETNDIVTEDFTDLLDLENGDGSSPY